jgi:hypothetical protein
MAMEPSPTAEATRFTLLGRWREMEGHDTYPPFS